MKIPFASLLKRINGISTPVFGVSWNPKESEREKARKLMIYLEDRRALYNPYHWEIVDQVVASVLDIRKYLTQLLQDLDEDSYLSYNVRVLRAACRKYLDYQHSRQSFNNAEMTALGELRGIFGIQVAEVCIKYGIDIEETLIPILPFEDTD